MPRLLPTGDHCHVHLKYLKPAHKRPSGQGGRCTQCVPCCLQALEVLNFFGANIPSFLLWKCKNVLHLYRAIISRRLAAELIVLFGALDPISDRRGAVGHERPPSSDDTSIAESDLPQS